MPISGAHVMALQGSVLSSVIFLVTFNDKLVGS